MSQAAPFPTTHVDRFATERLPPREQWPDILLDRAEFHYPDRLNCVTAFLDDWVDRGAGERICLRSLEETLTYKELHLLVNRIANVLVQNLGLVTGNRVLLRSANSTMMVACYLAVIKAGGIVVPTMPLLRAHDLRPILDKSAPSIILCDGRIADELTLALASFDGSPTVTCWNTPGPLGLEALIAAADTRFDAAPTFATDICLIAFTSGTTGVPKGTMHFHRDLLIICDGYARQIVCPTRDDRIIGSAPLAFTFGLAMVLFPLRVGGTALVVEKVAPVDLARAIETLKATICFTAPTAYKQMAATTSDVSSLRLCVSAGEPLRPAIAETWKARTGLPLIDGIGGTEMLHIYLSQSPEDFRPGPLGKAVTGFEVRVVDADGNDVPRGTIGLLAVRGPIGCRYLDDPRQTNYVRGGWNYPGDSGYIDDDGYFWYQSRSDDMIVSSGYNIAGPEVEDSLLRHPAVAECGVVGAPDADRGQVVQAFVVVANGFSADETLCKELQAFVKADIAPYKYPRLIHFVSELPKTPSGKIRRSALRARELTSA